MIKQYSINIKIEKEVHLPSLLKSLGQTEDKAVSVSVLRDGQTKAIKCFYAEETTVDAVVLTQEEIDQGLSKELKAAKAIYDAHTVESSFLSFSREDKLDGLRALVKPLIDEADKLVNKKEDLSLSSTAERAYRQALRDVTEPYKADMSLLDSVDLASFVFPTKP